MIHNQMPQPHEPGNGGVDRIRIRPPLNFIGDGPSNLECMDSAFPIAPGQDQEGNFNDRNSEGNQFSEKWDLEGRHLPQGELSFLP